MAITQIADLAQARQNQATQQVSTKQLALNELPELTQEFIAWHEGIYGPIVNTQYSYLTDQLIKAQNKAVRITRNAVNRTLYMGVDFTDIEPLIKEGIFIYVKEAFSPSQVSGTAKPIQNPEQFMRDYYYSVNLVKA